MPLQIISNEEPAAGTIRGGLKFVWTTTRSTRGKDNRHEYVQHPVAPIKAR